MKGAAKIGTVGEERFVIDQTRSKARRVFERLLEIRNDVGLLAEEYDPVGRPLLGNFPQAFSHDGFVNTAHNLQRSDGPADRQRSSPQSLRSGNLGPAQVEQTLLPDDGWYNPTEAIVSQ